MHFQLPQQLDQLRFVQIGRRRQPFLEIPELGPVPLRFQHVETPIC